MPFLKGIVLASYIGHGPKVTALDADPTHTPPTYAGVSVGDRGIADSLLRPAGRVKINGRVVDVVSDGSFVDQGIPIQVIKINGNVITVTEVEAETES